MSIVEQTEKSNGETATTTEKNQTGAASFTAIGR